MLIVDASWTLVGLSLHRDAHLCACACLCVCCWWSKEIRCSNTARAHAEDSAQLAACSVVSKTHIQAIVFYLLAQTKVIYLHIYKPINKVS